MAYNMKSAFSSTISIVLDQTSHPGNIGAAARAMKTMGLSKLILVNPKTELDSVAYARASGATDVLDTAQHCNSLTEALADQHLVYATSARTRHISLPTFTAKTAAYDIQQQATPGTQISIVFGNEQHGLDNHALQQAHKQIIIPTNPIYSSLNLASAVQIIAYELYAITPTDIDSIPVNMATHAQRVSLYDHLVQTLQRIDFIQPERSAKITQKIQVLLNKIPLSYTDTQIVRGVLSEINKRLPD